MFNQLDYTMVIVSDMKRSIEFYRDKLGFEVDTDAMMGADYRWLTMRIKGQPGFEIILMEPKAGMMLERGSPGGTTGESRLSCAPPKTRPAITMPMSAAALSSVATTPTRPPVFVLT